MGEIRLVPVLFTDIEGSTRAWEEHPDEMSAVLADHDLGIRNAISSHGGEVFSTAGDSFAARLPSALDALLVAIDAQRAIKALAVKGEPLRVRMAIHAGEIERRDGDWFGPALNQCARLRDSGHGGQVLVSEVAQQLLKGRLPDGVSLEDLGEHRLRDLSHRQRIFGVVHPDLDGGFPPLRSLGATNLPVQVTSFVGRVQESAELEKLIRGSRLATVVGAGGCGKSRLAVQVAGGMAGEFPDGVRLVELAALFDPQLVASAVATAVGVREQSGRDVLGSLAGFLRTRRLLLVLDNCEHVIEAVAELAGHLLSQVEGLRLLATSRERLHVRGEAVFHLAPLPVLKDDDPVNIIRSDGVRLFGERAEAADPGFRLAASNASSVADICARVDGIPLAIELVAAASRLLSLELVQKGLGDRFNLPGVGARDDVDHHRTLKATIDWSFRLLDADQQVLFERLAIFAGPFSVDAAETVCSDDVLPAGRVLGTVAELADRSLLEIDDTDIGVRYRMLETIRAFATDRLSGYSRRSREQFRERHCDYFASLVGETSRVSTHAGVQQTWLAELDSSLPDLRGALAWAVGSGRDQEATDLFVALLRYSHVRGLWAEVASWLQSVPMRSAGVSVSSRVHALAGAANELGSMSTATEEDRLAAEGLANEALQLARKSDVPSLIAVSLQSIWRVSDASGAEARAEAMGALEEGMVMAERAGNLQLQLGFRSFLAWQHRYDGLVQRDPSLILRARAQWEENLARARSLGSHRSVGLDLGHLSANAFERDLVDTGRIRTESLDEGHRLVQQSLEIGRELGDFVILSNGLAWQGTHAYLKRDLEAARGSFLEQAALARRSLGNEHFATIELAFTDYALGDLRSAHEWFRKALALFDPPPGHPWMRLLMGRTIWGLGRLLARQNQPGPAAAVFGAVEAAEPDMVHPYIEEQQDQADYRECLDILQSDLTPDELRRARQEGLEMTMSQAIAYAARLLDNA